MSLHSYVTSLENKVEKMEALLKRVRTPFELENLYSASSVGLLCARDLPVFRKNRRQQTRLQVFLLRFCKVSKSSN